ncbi:copper homeostasis protein CutC [Virgibacillus sp. MSJ-26]|uniref:copper homeostasis protein CutC n=1 Tax=Virgibacillus sp. MSJ-26 TaxID=2841522 RepID=UPI001C11F458|nr:copper homeostasis protein CutC [Virgibacillus sp. MSJ-26]MBU5468644.1 copper homeostasis protein CutC [Virgibacillus sp. MSJ-26]
MKIEVITLNKEDTLQAEKLGADRVELVSAMLEGGLTPSYGTIKNVLNSVNIPVQIMIRPHSYGFVYDQKDWKTMKEDISAIKELGGNRIVFGAITEQGEVDEKLLNKVIEHAPDFDITFHRAFDHVSSQVEAYKVLNQYKKNVKRILTSGGKDKAENATSELHELVKLSKKLNGPSILVGSGVSPDNLAHLHKEIGASEYHIGSGVRIDRDMSKALSSEEIAKVLSVFE